MIPSTDDQPAAPPAPSSRKSRILWFIGLWCASLGTVLALSMVIKMAINAIK